MLSREVGVGLRDLRWQHQSIVLVAAGLAQFLEPFRSQHFPQCVRRIDGAIDDDVDDVDAFRTKLGRVPSQEWWTLAERRFSGGSRVAGQAARSIGLASGTVLANGTGSVCQPSTLRSVI